MSNRDTYTEEVKDAFARDPRRLADALGLRVDELRSRSVDTWCFDGNEDQASLVIHSSAHPQYPGVWKRFGDGNAKGDCFTLVKWVRPQSGFGERRDFVAGVYGIAKPEAQPRRGTQRVARRVRYEARTVDVVIAIHERIEFEGGGKTFVWRGPDGRGNLPAGVRLVDLPLYRGHLLADVSKKRGVIVTEGEKDADAAASIGVDAVGTFGSEVVPMPDALACLRGRAVVLWADNDNAGRKHMEAVAAALDGIAARVFWVKWDDAPEKGGAAEFVAGGGTVGALKELVVPERPWEVAPASDVESAMADAVDETPYTDTSIPAKGARPVVDLAAEIITNVEERRMLPRRIYGLRTGFRSIDWHFLGLAFQGLILVCGDSGRGKTTFARHCAYATCDAIRDEEPDAKLLFYVLEGGKDQFLRYYAGYKHGLPASVFAPGSEDVLRNHPEYDDRLRAAYSDFVTLPLDVCDNLTDADAILHDIEAKIAAGPVWGVVIDNIQLLTFPWGGDYQGSKAAAKRFLDLSDKTHVPVMVLSQINRDRNDWKPRGGPEWRNNATCVFYIDRGENGSSDEEKAQSNLLRLYNTKVRYERPLPEMQLLGDFNTGRLREPDEYNAMQAAERVAERRGQ